MIREAYRFGGMRTDHQIKLHLNIPDPPSDIQVVKLFLESKLLRLFWDFSHACITIEYASTNSSLIGNRMRLALCLLPDQQAPTNITGVQL
jgi:hypothetical protein